MRDLIRSVPEAEAAYESNDDQLVVDILNRLDAKKKALGFVSIASMGNELTVEIVTRFVATLRGVVKGLGKGNQTQQAQSMLVGGFLNRFINAERGIDFANDKLRPQLVGFLVSGGWEPEEIQVVMDLGYTMTSAAVAELNREATLGDVAQARDADSAEAFAIEFNAAWNTHISVPHSEEDRDATVAGLRAMADELER